MRIFSYINSQSKKLNNSNKNNLNLNSKQDKDKSQKYKNSYNANIVYKNHFYYSFKGAYISPVNTKKIEELDIPNLAYIGNNSYRGESLSSKKNRKFLSALSKNGIKNIIDLREKYANKNFDQMCEQYSLNYFRIPVDSSSVDNKELIGNLPLLFKTLDKGRTYIACAQGLHRTDIALAINYIFNPKEQKTPPIMYGHIKQNEFKFETIFRRINSIKKEITSEDIKKLGWEDLEKFEKAFLERKKLFREFNEQLAKDSTFPK